MSSSMTVSAAPSPSAASVRPGSWAAWSLAMRPRTLLVAVSPVLVGVALAWERTGAFDALAVALMLAAAVVIQIVSNLQNDVGYTERGAEASGTRTGLPRATAIGALTPAQVRGAIAALVLLALLLGAPLVALRGWPVFVIGAASLGAALAYMGGPRPIAYTPLGEFMVFLFFGLVAVVGTDYVLTGDPAAPATWLAAAALGCIAAAVLAVNNHRDIGHDHEVGRRTFAVLFGARASRSLYAAALTVPFALTVPMALAMRSVWLLLPLLLAPAALRLLRDFATTPPGLAFNALLFRTAKLELAFALLVAAGAVADRLA